MPPCVRYHVVRACLRTRGAYVCAASDTPGDNSDAMLVDDAGQGGLALAPAPHSSPGRAGSPAPTERGPARGAISDLAGQQGATTSQGALVTTSGAQGHDSTGRDAGAAGAGPHPRQQADGVNAVPQGLVGPGGAGVGGGGPTATAAPGEACTLPVDSRAGAGLVSGVAPRSQLGVLALSQAQAAQQGKRIHSLVRGGVRYRV